MCGVPQHTSLSKSLFCCCGRSLSFSVMTSDPFVKIRLWLSVFGCVRISGRLSSLGNIMEPSAVFFFFFNFSPHLLTKSMSRIQMFG